jgi:molecular chaperone GrpE
MNKNQENMQENDFTPPMEEEGLSMDVNVRTGDQGEKVQGVSPDEIQKLTEDLGEQKDKYVRLFAEFDNYKRRTSREAIELRQTAGKEVIISLLDVLDDMDRAEKQLQETDDKNSLDEGILLIFDKFRKILHARGLRALDTLHTDFDVEKDEAVSEIPVDDKKLKGKVVAELQKGYYLNDKLIRFAKVVVGK